MIVPVWGRGFPIRLISLLLYHNVPFEPGALSVVGKEFLGTGIPVRPTRTYPSPRYTCRAASVQGQVYLSPGPVWGQRIPARKDTRGDLGFREVLFRNWSTSLLIPAVWTS